MTNLYFSHPNGVKLAIPTREQLGYMKALYLIGFLHKLGLTSPGLWEML